MVYQTRVRRSGDPSKNDFRCGLFASGHWLIGQCQNAQAPIRHTILNCDPLALHLCIQRHDLTP
jgi:hypothetical protein